MFIEIFHKHKKIIVKKQKTMDFTRASRTHNLIGTYLSRLAILNSMHQPLAGPWGGAPGARPPNDRGPMLLYAKNAIFFSISS